jgi:ABC-type transporter Mla subunit MlaD
MNTDKINETLATLETNLRNIKSASEQVELVTDSSDNLVNSVNNLLTETKQLSNYFKEREENSLKEIKQFKSLTEELNTSQKTFIKGIIDTHESHLMNFENSIKKLKSDTENEILKIK